MDYWLSTALSAGAGYAAVAYALRVFLGKYLEKKGENLATKEDIGAITKKMEQVRHEYSGLLESTKADLAALLKIHGFRYEKEYGVLSSLSSLLVDLRDSSKSLRPIADTRDPSKTEDEIKQERLARHQNATREIYLASERNRPFFPADIYDSINRIMDICHSEAIDYWYRSPMEDKDAFRDYWDTAQRNQEQIVSRVNDTMSLIRNRVSKWESLS